METSPDPRKMSPLALVLVLSFVFFMVFVAVSAALFMYRGPGKGMGSSGRLFGGEAVGVLELNGVIMDSKKVLARLDRYAERDDIKAVVLRLNSPGGSVAPSQEIYEAVRAYKKPLVVSMGSVAASGAYYIACGAKRVYANAGTITGSIGVIMEFANLEKLYEWAKIQRYVIKTGKFKDAGAEFRSMTAEERALLQAMVDDVLMQFKKAVSMGRKLSLEQVTAVADGRIFSGAQAKAAHLVDEIGTLQNAIDEAARMAKISGKPRVIYPERARRKWWEMIMDEPTPDDSSESFLQPGIQPGLGGLLGGLEKLSQAIAGASSDSRPAGIYWIWTGAR